MRYTADMKNKSHRCQNVRSRCGAIQMPMMQGLVCAFNSAHCRSSPPTHVIDARVVTISDLIRERLACMFRVTFIEIVTRNSDKSPCHSLYD
jgi:hypothetical protein